MRARPLLSVCVIQFTSRAHLIRCLDALGVQQGVEPEVLVPYDDSLEDSAGLRARFPHCSFLHSAGRRTPAELRATATHASSGEIISFLEDHCVPVSDWAMNLLDAHGAPHAAVGGAVDKGFLPGERGDSALNWAVYFTDYSRYMNPQPGGSATSLTDCNVSYKRAALDAIRESWEMEFHENVVNDLLAERGGTLWLAPQVLVHEQRSLTLGSALRDRYAFGRLFGSTRVAGVPLVRRLTLAAGAGVMPPVLIARVAGNLFRRRRHRAQFFRTLPVLALVTSTWMLGEFVGYLTGRAAPSLRAATGHGMNRSPAAVEGPHS
jgi:hypothetical protein